MATNTRYAAFLSYSRTDDTHHKGLITHLATLISSEVEVQTGNKFPIFQDREGLKWGDNWEKKIKDVIYEVTYLIAVISPTFFTSSYCKEELAHFSEREKSLGRDDLILPIHLIAVRDLDYSEDEAVRLIRGRQISDFRDLRHEDPEGQKIRKAVALLASEIVDSMESGHRSHPEPSRRQPSSSQRKSLLIMTRIPRGDFVMGSDDSEARQRETPARQVTIPAAFAMSRCPVTVAQFRAFCEETQYKTQWERRKDGAAANTWRNPGFLQSDECPVVYVSWFDANEFCRWLSDREKKIYRLSTEAEWEYACRARTGSKWFCGDDVDDLENYAWYRQNSEGTMPVGQKSPNPFDLFDMHGNVWEWCSDCYASDQLMPPPRSRRYRAARGGSWVDAARHLRSSFRIRIKPFQACNNLGFRVVLEGEG